ncbi:hypothetical protein G6F68_011967 [Rhizopus microsporus]|nr:hypothetical protein G6F68_011967 [Rhizopus microsporus]
MLPGHDGYTVLELLRARKKTPVLMLSARGSVDERVKGLRKGADDYLPKPFSFTELVARIQALLRRGAGASGESTLLQVADLQVDMMARRAMRGGQRLDLTAKEFALLSLLARHEGEILSKLMIAEQVWDMNFDSDANVVEVAMRRLRPRCARCGATARLSDEGVHLDAPGVDVRPVRGADRVGLCGAAAWIVESVVAAADAQRTGIAPLTAGSVADVARFQSVLGESHQQAQRPGAGRRSRRVALGGQRRPFLPLRRRRTTGRGLARRARRLCHAGA